jgi:hypothetical protein
MPATMDIWQKIVTIYGVEAGSTRHMHRSKSN